jgi:hypothetical protein
MEPKNKPSEGLADGKSCITCNSHTKIHLIVNTPLSYAMCDSSDSAASTAARESKGMVIHSAQPSLCFDLKR